MFYRTNAQSRALEEVFIRTGLPYKVVGGTRFYERREIRDVLAYLRVVANPADDVSLRRILNVPKRGIGDRAEAYVSGFAEAERITFGEALRRADEIPGMAGRSATVVAAFVAILDRPGRGRRLRRGPGRHHARGAGALRVPRGAAGVHRPTG